jgi:ATP-dependent DNA ligase
MDFEEGKGRLQGTLGAIVGGLFKDGILTKTCTVGGGFDDALRSKIWNNKTEYYLKVMEVSGKMYFEKTGAVRHPAFKHFRFDKSASECKWLDPNG